MEYTKQLSITILSVLCINFQLNAFKWQDITQATYRFIQQNPKPTVLALAALISGSLYAVTWHYFKKNKNSHNNTPDFQTLAAALLSDDPLKFKKWAAENLNMLEAKHSALSVQESGQARQQAIDNGFWLSNEILKRILELIRRTDRTYDKFSIHYFDGTVIRQATPQLEGSSEAHAISVAKFRNPALLIKDALQIDVIKSTFEQYITALKIQKDQSMPGSSEFTLYSEINSLAETPFGWQDIKAYSLGKKYFSHLHRIPRTTLEPLFDKAIQIRDLYNGLQPTEHIIT